MGTLDETLSEHNSTPITYKGFDVYNPKADLLPAQTTKENAPDAEPYVPISANVKKVVVGAGLGGALILAGTISYIPFPEDLVGMIAAPFLAIVGFAAYMSYENVKNPPKYSSFVEMLAHFKEDTEPKNRVYSYLKKRLSSNKPSIIETLIARHKKTKELESLNLYADTYDESSPPH